MDSTRYYAVHRYYVFNHSTRIIQRFERAINLKLMNNFRLYIRVKRYPQKNVNIKDIQ